MNIYINIIACNALPQKALEAVSKITTRYTPAPKDAVELSVFAGIHCIFTHKVIEMCLQVFETHLQQIRHQGPQRVLRDHFGGRNWTFDGNNFLASS